MAIITVSRGSMSGGEALATCLAQMLGYPCLAREVLVRAAEKLGVPEDMLRGKIERSAGLWERLTTDRRVYLVALQSALADQCVSGDLVYHGHAGHMLLEELPNVLRVRLIAPMAMRIRAVMERQRLDYEAARDFIRNVDQERIRWTNFVYGVDWHDPTNYDLVINLHNMSLEIACAMVAGAVKLPAYATTPAVQKKLKDFALACRVKLALVANVHARSTKFSVRADEGRVEIFGEVAAGGVLVRQAGPSAEEIGLIAKTVEGVKEAVVDLRKFPESSEA